MMIKGRWANSAFRYSLVKESMLVREGQRLVVTFEVCALVFDVSTPIFDVSTPVFYISYPNII
jgi:hypothetical protein